MKIIQPTQNKNDNKVENYTLVHEAEEWKIEPIETRVSYGVVNLYPSILLDRSINLLTFPKKACRMEKETTATKCNGHSSALNIVFMRILFFYNNLIRMLQNLGSIALSIMVI